MNTDLQDWEQRLGLTFGDREGWGPLGPQDIQTNTAIAVDVGVEDLSGEGHLGTK